MADKKVLEMLDDGKGKKIVAGKSIRLSANMYEEHIADVNCGCGRNCGENADSMVQERRGGRCLGQKRYENSIG
ncbi:MAG: hypothetical protein K2I21_07200 [Acetatifactor sp.]|nr:hypothetical protein [Acetatifactor sp.]